MRAYAVRFAGDYWLVNAQNAAQAKGAIIRLALEADRQYTRHFAGLRCRRWPAFDGSLGIQVMHWGVPGTRDYETGARIEMPEPFQRQEVVQ